MKIVKKEIKEINKLAVLGLIGGASIIATQSAFTSDNHRQAEQYGFDQSKPANENPWVLVEGKTMDNSEDPAPNTYRCDESENICTGLFDSPPTSAEDEPNANTTTPGDFSLN